MAKYRPTFTKIWYDPDFQEYSLEERSIFIYLFTHPQTTESGIYPISPKTISQQTLVDQKDVEQILKEGRLKNIEYDFENKVVFVVNFLRYNGRGRPSLALKSIYNDFINIKTPLWESFKTRYPLYYESVLILKKELEKTSIPNPMPKLNPKPNPTSNPNPISTSNHNPNHTPNKVPVKEMLEIFENYWNLWNEGSYLHDHETEQQVAEILYNQCLIDRPEDPLGLFDEKVETLIIKYRVKQFVGLHKFWNAAADRDMQESTKEEENETNDN